MLITVGSDESELYRTRSKPSALSGAEWSKSQLTSTCEPSVDSVALSSGVDSGTVTAALAVAEPLVAVTVNVPLVSLGALKKPRELIVPPLAVQSAIGSSRGASNWSVPVAVNSWPVPAGSVVDEGSSASVAAC